jgi:transposase
MRKKGGKNKVYRPEFKIAVIEKMRKEQMSYHETMREYFPHLCEHSFCFLKKWERIYLEEGADGLMKERRGISKLGVRKCRAKKLDEVVEEDLIAENQRLRMENEYLKKLHALALSKIKLEKETKPE